MGDRRVEQAREEGCRRRSGWRRGRPAWSDRTGRAAPAPLAGSAPGMRRRSGAAPKGFVSGGLRPPHWWASPQASCPAARPVKSMTEAWCGSTSAPRLRPGTRAEGSRGCDPGGGGRGTSPCPRRKPSEALPPLQRNGGCAARNPPRMSPFRNIVSRGSRPWQERKDDDRDFPCPGRHRRSGRCRRAGGWPASSHPCPRPGPPSPSLRQGPASGGRLPPGSRRAPGATPVARSLQPSRA